MDPEIAVYEALAKEILRRCLAETPVTELYGWLAESLKRLGGGTQDGNAAMTWAESFVFTDQMLERFRMQAGLPPNERKELTWPWASWNKYMDKLQPGFLATITAPDGQGKSTYVESVAEHWARGQHNVVYVHFELNRQVMMLRRLARHTSIETRQIRDWDLTPEQVDQIRQIRPLLESWDGHVTYVHTPDWNMERTIAELRRLNAEGLCDVVVVDYLEKAAASKRQIQLFGNNLYAREADNVELLKSFAEIAEVPVVMVAQMSKAGKSASFNNMDRTGMRGAGEKSEKANLVVMLHREHENGAYSPIVKVLIDKQTMGPTASFEQIMRPAYFQVADLAV